MEDLGLIRERLSEMEGKAQELVRYTQELQNEKAALGDRLSKLDRELAQEKEKSIVSSLRAHEEKSLTLKVETNLRDIQDRLRRDQRERESESTRVKAEAQLKELERRLAQERETWVEALRNQMAKKSDADHHFEERYQARVREIETRFTQERARIAAKLEEKNREIEELKKRLVIETENIRTQDEKKFAVDQMELKVLKSKLEELSGEVQEKRWVAKELAATAAQLQKLELSYEQSSQKFKAEHEQEVFKLKAQIEQQEQRSRLDGEAQTQRIRELEGRLSATTGAQAGGQKTHEEYLELRAKLDAYKRAIRERDNILQKARWALLKLRREQQSWQVNAKEMEQLRVKVQESGALAAKANRERSQILELAKKKIQEVADKNRETSGQKNTHIERLENAAREAEHKLLRLDKETKALIHEKEFLASEIDNKDRSIVRLTLDLEAAQRSLGQIPALLKELDVARGRLAETKRQVDVLSAKALEAESLMEALSVKEKIENKLSQENAELKKILEAANAHAQALGDELSVMRSALEISSQTQRALESKMSQLAQDNESSLKQFWSKRQSVLKQEFERFGDSLSGQLRAVAQESENYAKTIQALDVSLRQTREDLAKTQADLARSKKETGEFTEAKVQWENSKSKYESELGKIKQLSQEYFLNYEKKIEHLNQELQAHQEKENALIAEVEGLKERPWNKVTKLFKGSK